jgi:hypothetical protein
MSLFWIVHDIDGERELRKVPRKMIGRTFSLDERTSRLIRSRDG